MHWPTLKGHSRRVAGAVQLPKGPHRLGNGNVMLSFFGHVQAHELPLTALAVDLIGHLFACIHINVGNGDGCSRFSAK